MIGGRRPSYQVTKVTVEAKDSCTSSDRRSGSGLGGLLNRICFTALAATLPFAVLADASGDCRGFNSDAFFESATRSDVAACLKAGANLFEADSDGLTPLFHAVRTVSDPRILDQLLGAADGAGRLDEILNHWDRHKRNPMLYAAAEARDPATITWLSSWGHSVHMVCEGFFESCPDPLLLAARRPDSFIFVATLLALGAKPDSSIGLVSADYDTRALLNRGSWNGEPIGQSGTSSGEPLDCANFLTEDFFREANALQVRACLVGGGYPTAVDRNGRSAVHLGAIYAEDPRTIDVLLQKLQSDGILEQALSQTDLEGKTPLHMAAEQSGNPRLVSRLLAWGADPNALAPPISRRRLGSDRGTTALHLAARRTDAEREPILTLLLAAGANARLQDHGEGSSGGRQALHYAAFRAPDVRVVALLLEAERLSAPMIGGSSHVTDEGARTALHAAAYADADLDVIKVMLSYGLSPDDRGADGITPLMRSAQKATDPDVFLTMLDASTSPCRGGDNGATVLGYLKTNEALMTPDPSGRQESPLKAFRNRCP